MTGNEREMQEAYERAMERVRAESVRVTNEGRYKATGERFWVVRNGQSGREYLVTQRGRRLECNCEAGQHDRYCKHRAAVRASRLSALAERQVGAARPTEPPAAYAREIYQEAFDLARHNDAPVSVQPGVDVLPNGGVRFSVDWILARAEKDERPVIEPAPVPVGPSVRKCVRCGGLATDQRITCEQCSF